MDYLIANLPPLPEFAFHNLLATALRYLGAAVSLYLLLYAWKTNPWAHRRIQKSRISKSTLLTEIRWSLLSCFVFTLVGTTVYYCLYHGYSQVYLDHSKYSVTYTVLSIPGLFLLHDAHFYWTHRVSHEIKFIYRRIHYIHHSFPNPSPFSEIAFHPVDALIHVSFIPIAFLLIPLHPIAMAVFLVGAAIANTLGHMGYEIFPANMNRHWLYRWISPPTVHNMHHSRSHCNYGLYLSFWDRVCGTLHNDFDRTYDMATAEQSIRIDPESEVDPMKSYEDTA